MNIITAILTMICQLFMAIFGPVIRLVRKDAAVVTKAANGQLRKMIIVILAVLVIAGSLTSIFLSMRSTPSGDNNRRLFIGLGQALADETASVLYDNGRIVVIITPDFFLDGTPAHLELNAFQRELKRHSGLSVIATEKAIVPETDPDQNLPRAEFEKILGRYPQATALVSFIGLPTLDPENPYTIPKHAPKIIALYNIAGAAKAYFTSSIATLLIVPRGLAANRDATKPPKTPREAFDRFYRVCTTANYESVLD